jgi:hypothetical protein
MHRPVQAVFALLFAALPLLAAPIQHRFVCIDNGRNRLHLIDQFEPESSWSRDIPAGSRDLQILPGNRLLVSHGNGAAEYDLKTGKPLAWKVNDLSGINTAQRLPDGSTIFGANTAEGIRYYLYDSHAQRQKTWLLPKAKDLRLLRILPNGNLIHTTSTPEHRVVEVDRQGNVLHSVPLEGKGYKAIALPNGHVLATTGGTCTVVELDWQGKTYLRVGGKKENPKAGLDWFSGFDALPNGHILTTNWLGHGKQGTGPHLVEFDRDNHLVWQWEDHKLAAQITNVLVLDPPKQAAAEAPGPGASLEVNPSEGVLVKRLTQNALIHTNRDYRFRGIPKRFLGLDAIRHAHRRPATLTCKVRSAGTIWLALGEGATVKEHEGFPDWGQVARMKGDDGGAKRDWIIYEADVKKGQTFTIKSPNKWGAVLLAKAVTIPKTKVDTRTVNDREFRYLQGHLAKRPDAKRQHRLRNEAYDRQALIQKQDRDPLDVVLRRTQALLADLRSYPETPSLAAEGKQLAKLAEQAKAMPLEQGKERRQLFDRVCALRKQIAFKNPLLDFSRIAFITRFKSRRTSGANHMCDQYFGFNANQGGGLYVLDDPFGAKPIVHALLASTTVANGRLQGKRLVDGAFASLELSFDAQTLYFAWTQANPSYGKWRPDSTYHIFGVNADGTGLRQLTDGEFNDFDPCELPDGRLAFISGRRGGFGRCHGRPVPTYTLHSMGLDGSDIRTLSYHETNEWHPSVDHNGMLVYTRWDYVDRDSDVAHHIWTCFPDGSDPRSYHGNYPLDRHSRPWMEMSIRAVPDSHRYMAVAAPHHGQAYGSLVLIDERLDDDGSMSQLKRLTPETPFPESERGRLLYASPWPLSEKYWLCAFDWRGEHYGIYLVDAFGNRILIYEDAEVPVLDPIPLRPRPRPPVIAEIASPAEKARDMATVAIMNVYEADFPWPSGMTAASLRIVQLFPKATIAANHPNIGAGNQSLARGVLGTVPIEADGSAYFEMPAGIPVYFQVLDENGVMIQNMRSDTFAQPGTTLACLGCHEPKRKAGPTNRKHMPMALRRQPSAIEPEFTAAFPLTFPRLVQPVLDRNCLKCHDGQKHDGKVNKVDLRGDQFVGNGWSRAFESLRKYGWARHGGNGSIKRNHGSRSRPGKDGARGSRLYPLLLKGHGKTHLSPEEMRRITLWLDCNSNFYGAYHDLDKQARGEAIMPAVR